MAKLALNVGELKKQAETELQEEREKEAKKRLKDLLKKRDDAQRIADNYDREIELLELELQGK